MAKKWVNRRGYYKHGKKGPKWIVGKGFWRKKKPLLSK